MSKYTTQVRWIVEQKLDDLKLNHDETNWDQVYTVLGLDDYPIFDELYRQTLNDKIIRHYYFREIGFETAAQFKWYMRQTMHEIMPYYNQLYKSENLITDPLLSMNKDYTEEWTRDEVTKTDNTSASKSDGISSTDSKNVFQDTPMNGLDTGAIQSMDYATNVTFDNSSSDSSNTSSSQAENAYTGDFDGTKKHNEKGYDKSQSELLQEYRKTFLNIDVQIIDELADLFMGLW